MIFPHSDQLVVLVDDDDQLRKASVQSLELGGIEANAFANAPSALKLISRDFNGVVVTDVRMPRMDGLELFEKVKEVDPEIPVIFMTGHADVPVAVRALRDGAFDFLTKPFAVDELIVSIRNALEKRRLVMDNRALRDAISEGESPLIGDSPQMIKLRQSIAQIAQADIDVLIEGETGTGKELVALMLHRQSQRRGKPFVAVDCSALSDTLAEVELFGSANRPGAGNGDDVVGRIEASSSGTLYLDDIDGTSPSVQASLLRVIEEREVVRVGSMEPRPVNLRVIAAAKQDLGRLSATGEFRRDLFYRLNVVRLQLPPLREHRADIPQLFSYFIDEAKRQMGIAHFVMNDEVRRHLFTHDWPGNVRELRNFAFEAVLGVENPRLIGEDPKAHVPLMKRVEQFEAAVIRDALRLTGGNVPEAAKLLRIPRKTLYDKLARHQIIPKSFRRVNSKGG